MSEREPRRLKLTLDEFNQAYGEAKSRERTHDSMGLADRVNPGSDRFNRDFGNAAGYVLLARLAGAEWTQSHGPRRHSPVSPWRPHWRGDPTALLVRPDEADHELHVLMGGVVPGRQFDLWGFMIGEDAKRYPLDENLAAPAHVVPRGDLLAVPEKLSLDHLATLMPKKESDGR
jgi:hypothetical protein